MGRNNDIRIWAYIIALAIYLLIRYPIPTILILVILFITYIVINSLPNMQSRSFVNNSKYESRRRALEIASMYLAPYNDIWRNLRLSNKYCSLKLGRDGTTITAYESATIGSGRSFRVVRSKVYPMREVWDMYCVNFDHLTSYDGLKELADTFKLTIAQSYIPSTKNKLQVQTTNSGQTNYTKNTNEKLDINNASEVEITALPGISIVMAKRIIKKREEIRGFKSLDDLFIFLKLKPHMQEQLKNLVCVKKMEGTLKIERYKERKLDL